MSHALRAARSRYESIEHHLPEIEKFVAGLEAGVFGAPCRVPARMPRSSPSQSRIEPHPMTDNDNLKTIRILKSRFTEVTRQAVATLDLHNVLTEAGAQITPEIRQLMLNAVHTTMTLAVIDLLKFRRLHIFRRLDAYIAETCLRCMPSPGHLQNSFTFGTR
jgi:hypothetical protein